MRVGVEQRSNRDRLDRQHCQPLEARRRLPDFINVGRHDAHRSAHGQAQQDHRGHRREGRRAAAAHVEGHQHAAISHHPTQITSF